MTYETVVAATHGDPVAAEEVLDHFDSTIDGLCTHAFVDEGGHTEYGVDTQMKTEMQGRLLAAMLHFKP
ncbi:MAG TPA: helix-turn-helix domain-containing protein [Candidatus Acutalibacter pullicola]|uniref:Helix-turn-helix domain-containing protein n=1 Tax=Candidatus Acutalibacter pullicola TaxID=2838417 RepID=A0A9D2SFL8_9FIRM|nr:helix-turn-helix domain-containing protein [Candidatus Acutalibacter pullicola]